MPGEQVSPQWAAWRAAVDLDEYAGRWDALAASGEAVHGEAELVTSFGPRSVLDAGCGTGRVATELASRGIEVVGVDLDPDLLAVARARRPDLPWVCADLATLELDRSFDVVALPGNVLLFCRDEDRGAIVARLAAHLAPGGWMVAGFELQADRLTLDEHDTHAGTAGLVLADRWATWDRAPYDGGHYAVSVHRAPA